MQVGACWNEAGNAGAEGVDYDIFETDEKKKCQEQCSSLDTCQAYMWTFKDDDTSIEAKC